MTQVKPNSFDIGRKGIPPSQLVSNLNICHLQSVSLSVHRAICRNSENIEQ